MQGVRSLSPEKQPYSGSNFHLSKPEILKVSSPSLHFYEGIFGSLPKKHTFKLELERSIFLTFPGSFSLLTPKSWNLRWKTIWHIGRLGSRAQKERRPGNLEVKVWWNLIQLGAWWLVAVDLVGGFPSFHHLHSIFTLPFTCNEVFWRAFWHWHWDSTGIPVPDLRVGWVYQISHACEERGDHVGSPWTNLRTYTCILNFIRLHDIYTVYSYV